jgi:hypothetical protein
VTLRHQVGRRGAALLFFAGIDLVFFVSLVSAPTATRTSSSYAFLSSLLPLPVWAIPWGAVGLVCLFYAFRDRDRPAFIAASWLKVGWGCIYLAGWLVGEIPRGYVSAVIWLGFAGFVQVIASWPDSRER